MDSPSGGEPLEAAGTESDLARRPLGGPAGDLEIQAIPRPASRPGVTLAPVVEHPAGAGAPLRPTSSPGLVGPAVAPTAEPQPTERGTPPPPPHPGAPENDATDALRPGPQTTGTVERGAALHPRPIHEPDAAAAERAPGPARPVALSALRVDAPLDVDGADTPVAATDPPPVVTSAREIVTRYAGPSVDLATSGGGSLASHETSVRPVPPSVPQASAQDGGPSATGAPASADTGSGQHPAGDDEAGGGRTAWASEELPVERRVEPHPVDVVASLHRARGVQKNVTGATTFDTAGTSGVEEAVIERAPEAPLERIPHRALAESIVARARSLTGPGHLELRFALEPQDLGSVRVRIETQGDGIRIRIVASTAVAVDAIHSGLSRLVAQLADSGFREPSIDLSLDTAAHGGANHGRHPRDGEAGTPAAGKSRQPLRPEIVPLRGQAGSVRLDRLA